MSREEKSPGDSSQPSIYVRLMPLMYALIGAASVLFLTTLFCGGPFGSRNNKPCPSAPPAKEPACPVCTLPDSRSIQAADSGADRGVLQDATVHDTGTDGSSDVVTPTTRPTASSMEGQLTAAISPCVRKRARSFRLGLRLQADGKVLRVFVARDPGVNATMTECIRRQLAAHSFPTTAYGAGYLEWRVRRQAGGLLSLTLIRPAR